MASNTTKIRRCCYQNKALDFKGKLVKRLNEGFEFIKKTCYYQTIISCFYE